MPDYSDKSSNRQDNPSNTIADSLIDSNHKLWDELGKLSQPKPSTSLRQHFYRQLDAVVDNKNHGFFEHLKQWCGINGFSGLATATCCLIIGLVIGQLPWSINTGNAELSSLQQQVASLHRNFILDRLQDSSAKKRLLGILDAKDIIEDDPDIAWALLYVASQDNVSSIRSAAIEVLGPHLSTPAIGEELMALLEVTESPLVQVSLVEVVLRHGNQEQLQRLLHISESGNLHADLIQTVTNSVKRNQA